MDYIGKSGRYEYITQYDASGKNYTPGRGGNSVQYIIVHWWNAPGQGDTFESTIRVFQNPERGASAHFVLEGGRVACVVSLDDTAWHAGNFGMNQKSIGIECNPRCSAGDRETLAQLIADIWKEYGRELPVIGHRDVVATQCPGTYYGFLPDIIVRAKHYYMGGASPAEQEEEDMPQFTDAEAAWLKDLYKKHTATTASAWAKDDLKEAVEAGITTGERPQDVATREEVAIMISRASGKK